MNPLKFVDGRWFVRTLVALCVVGSLALIVLHKSTYGLRPNERIDAVEPATNR